MAVIALNEKTQAMLNMAVNNRALTVAAANAITVASRNASVVRPNGARPDCAYLPTLG